MSKTYEIRGSEMELLDGDTGLSADLRRDGIREPSATRAYAKALRAMGGEVTVVDVGANIGYYALQPCAILGDRARVIAIEPEPEALATLRRNVELNGYGDQVTVIDGAAGAESTTETLHVKQATNRTTLDAEYEGSETVATVDVSVEPLDDLLDDPADVDVLRMDVEGHEVDVLRGAEAVLRGADELLCNIELHPTLINDEATEWLLTRLREHPVDMHCLATNRPEEQTHEYVGPAPLFRHVWSPQMVFTWDLHDY